LFRLEKQTMHARLGC